MNRVFLIASFVILFFTIMFFSGRSLRGISSYQYYTPIDESPEWVFQFLTEKDKIKLWKPDLRQDFPMSRENLRPGTKGVSLNNYSEGTFYQFKVTELEMNHLLTLHVSTEESERKIRYLLVTKHGVTYLRYSEVSKKKSIIDRLFEPFLRRGHQDKIRENLLRLKKIAESKLV